MSACDGWHQETTRHLASNWCGWLVEAVSACENALWSCSSALAQVRASPTPVHQASPASGYVSTHLSIGAGEGLPDEAHQRLQLEALWGSSPCHIKLGYELLQQLQARQHWPPCALVLDRLHKDACTPGEADQAAGQLMLQGTLGHTKSGSATCRALPVIAERPAVQPDPV